MKKFLPGRHLGAAAVVTAALSSCNLSTAPAASLTRRPWQDEVIYFALTDRFSNGDASNDNGAGRPGDAADKTNPLGWHGGDFKGLSAKINQGYFKALGVSAIWVSPVVVQVPAIPVGDGPNKGKLFAPFHGYWAQDFKAIDPHFGSLDDFKALIATAHKHNIKIIQDIVLNHAGYGANLVTQHPEWFHTQAECDASGNQRTDCPLAGLPDFKQELPAVTAFLNDFARYWRSETAIDGFRIDTMQHVPDSYWQQFFAAGGAGDASKFWSVGEVFNFDPKFLANYLKLGSPSVFDFPLYGAINDQLSSGSGNLAALGDVFAQDGAYPDASRLTTFVDNHDVTRFVTQVTNKGGTAQEARERLDLALSLIYTARGTPSVYQGTEDAMPGKGDPYNYPLGEGNREDMTFPASPVLAPRLLALAQARASYPALRRGRQQELYRSQSLYAFRRVGTDAASGAAAPVVVVLNGSNAAVDLGALGGIPLLGTFEGSVKEITGRSSTLSVSGGKLVGSVPARSALILSGAAGSGSGAGAIINPALPEVASPGARAGDGAVGLNWTPSVSAAVSGYRIYLKEGGAAERQLNFAPIAAGTGSYVVRGLNNGSAYTFRIVTVDALGKESRGVSVSATPSAAATTKVTFTVDARSQGNGPIELRRFDTGAQLTYPMTQGERGIWKTTIDLPLYRDITFKFGNNGAGAKNSGYEGPNQPDRKLNTGLSTSYTGTYDFISVPVPTSSLSGRVTSGGTPVAGALLSASGGGANPDLNYALSFSDGSFTVLTSPGAQKLDVTRDGFTSLSRDVSAPASDLNIELPRPVSTTKYVIDGDLGDWSAAPLTLSSPAAGVFGDNNNWLSLKADSDDTYLYLAYTYKVDNNKAILYLDVKDGGASKADNLDAWKQAATFNAALPDFFLARYNNQAPELRRIDSDTATTLVAGSQYQVASSGSLPNQTVEVAIPWSALGLSGKPAGGTKLYGGIFGGDGYGAGDIVPDAGSTPPGANTIGSDAEQRKVTFQDPLILP
ncbi:alpha-amylase [Deinococcus irradiatisoli]|uniref:Alpha-amylase n=1 Tax=Deinococcus irradiatisoli TaxID=2202254 RepID=A0A2Z3JG53_9DEIO|nr:alpha-amylase family glycosyl hydrolase [Deinococcus irradiatisoli]AWN22350.1 alpha-amylase [Deinococcus irradiatisoli]